ncbi:MAG: hypothetical protein JWM63_4499 [Gammaproteobacteria bacterium]|nr:hypothetical protein [Gammaproteobacteria bacterium]
MITREANPVEWTLWMDELSEAHEHLGGLIDKLAVGQDYDESCFRVDIGHVMAHLNRAWARRNVERQLTDEEWEKFREYQRDLSPIA